MTGQNIRDNEIRVGAVSYLNTKPLVHRFAQLAPQVKLVFDLPSRLADHLAVGKLDVALIPSIEFLSNSDYARVSDACIGCVGPVMSVKLFSRVAPHEIQTLALDEGSRTSAAMVQIWLADCFGTRPLISSLAIGDGLRDATTDAVLLIGDRAIRTKSDVYLQEWDLGAHWVREYQAPFVFAVWTARPGIDLGDLAFALSAARDSGVANLSQIAAEECEHVGLTHTECLAYLRDNLYFHFGEQQQRGLDLFRDRAAHHDFLTPTAAGPPVKPT